LININKFSVMYPEKIEKIFFLELKVRKNYKFFWYSGIVASGMNFFMRDNSPGFQWTDFLLALSQKFEFLQKAEVT